MWKPVNVMGPVFVKFASKVTVPPLRTPFASRLIFAVIQPVAAVSTPVIGGTSLAVLIFALKWYVSRAIWDRTIPPGNSVVCRLM